MASKREGFLEDGSSKDMIKNPPFSQSSSSSSSSYSRENPLIIPPTYNHNHRNIKPSWLFNNKSQDQEEPIMEDSSSHLKINLIAPLANSENQCPHHLHQFIITRNAIEGGGECPPETGAMKEHMFDKVVTPSDVGKLNRLVIPKQHAEKYFPLDSSNNEKGLLLNFEDRNGKPWRFRYSYWNSSQSYVMTKGWSRFVKENKLDAGDIVSFQRNKDLFFIDWRRGPHPPPPLYRHHLLAPPLPPLSLFRPHNNSLYFPPQTMEQNKVHFLKSHNNVYGPTSFVYLKSTALGYGGGGGDGQQPQPTEVFESVPVVQGKVGAKRLRLFGVNMECPIMESSTSTNEC